MSVVHKATQRDYLARVNDPDFPKWKAAELATQFEFDYWDGDRRICYGGYRYMPGRWQKVADAMRDHYHLKPGDRVLDIGCGKGFLMHDFTLSVPGIHVTGIDISKHAHNTAKEEVKPFIQLGNANELPFEDNSFDFVYSLNTLHNLKCPDLDRALREMQRVSKQHAYLCVESFRNQREKMNLLYWQVTCEQFMWPDEWQWWFDRCGYTGDHSFIYFE